MSVLLNLLGIIFLIESGVIAAYNIKNVIALGSPLLGWVNTIASSAPTFSSAIIFFSLAIILEHSSKTVAFFERVTNGSSSSTATSEERFENIKSKMASGGSTERQMDVGRPDGGVKTNSGEAMTEHSMNILRQAKERGYAFSIQEDKTIVATKQGGGQSFLRSNSDIARFGKWIK